MTLHFSDLCEIYASVHLFQAKRRMQKSDTLLSMRISRTSLSILLHDSLTTVICASVHSKAFFSQNLKHTLHHTRFDYAGSSLSLLAPPHYKD